MYFKCFKLNQGIIMTFNNLISCTHSPIANRIHRGNSESTQIKMGHGPTLKDITGFIDI